MIEKLLYLLLRIEPILDRMGVRGRWIGFDDALPGRFAAPGSAGNRSGGLFRFFLEQIDRGLADARRELGRHGFNKIKARDDRAVGFESHLRHPHQRLNGVLMSAD